MEKSIIEMWSSPEKMLEYSKNAREHARKTHDKEKNFAKLQEHFVTPPKNPAFFPIISSGWPEYCTAEKSQI